MRQVRTGSFEVTREGGSWRALPQDLPDFGVGSWRPRRFQADGAWEAITDALRTALRLAAARAPEPAVAIIDAQSVKTTDKGGDAAGLLPARRETAAHGTASSRRSACCVPSLCLPPTSRTGMAPNTSAPPAPRGCRAGSASRSAAVPCACRGASSAAWLPRRERVVADGGYRGTLVGRVPATCGWTLALVLRTADRVGFEVLPRRWVVERTCAWLGRDRRLSQDYEGMTEVSEPFISVAISSHAPSLTPH